MQERKIRRKLFPVRRKYREMRLKQNLRSESPSSGCTLEQPWSRLRGSSSDDSGARFCAGIAFLRSRISGRRRKKKLIQSRLIEAAEMVELCRIAVGDGNRRLRRRWRKDRARPSPERDSGLRLQISFVWDWSTNWLPKLKSTLFYINFTFFKVCIFTFYIFFFDRKKLLCMPIDPPQ